MSNDNGANAVIADSVPQISDVPNVHVDLLRGLFNYETGEWQTKAVVRELNGEDEEFIASASSKKELSYAEYMSVLLSRSVLSIGDIDIQETPLLVDQLMIGDRDLLFLGTIKATYGRVRELEVTCGSCEGTNFITIQLDEDFQIQNADKDFHTPMEVTLKNGLKVKLNYPTGSDSLYVAKKGKTTAEQNTLMLARCTVWDGATRPENLEDWALALNLGDRSKLVKSLTTDPPGPRMGEVKTQCGVCNEELTLLMDWVSLLFG